MTSIKLREFRSEDWEAVHQYASLDEVCKYQPWGPNSVADSKAYVDDIIVASKKTPRTRFAYAITNKNKVIGACEVNVRDPHMRTGELSYILTPEWWGKGIATEVANMLLTFSFKNLGLHQVTGTCDERNIGSSRVLEKIGMSQESVIENHLLIRDGWRNSLIYAFSVDEWTREH
ncbi:GNAT family N-acetyltransferase [Guptibacillus algicola]|uniref:GNAT family N-acetyltransferase n=1 Tax=Guptibacillus algicola TaxID=225844 RepID=UPI001CD76B2A|nr:GNAT family N-acetyltransferase [Alkalihalobacillus algicola]MCA0988721.1 GNAT family N-acetyltransferase [Alkalihalobacillus algicola]